MESHNFITQKTARYFSIGEATKSVNQLWICLHGYGELAYYFGRKFRELESEKRLIVIPEGLNRFYLQGTEGRVGASWMTKEERLADIEDQFNYLENLTGTIKQELASDCKIHVLGFSQGVATALRWIDKSAVPFASLICWAGTFPPDIDYKLQKEKFECIKFHACFGEADEYISTEKAKSLIEQVQGQGIKVSPHFYTGGHKIYQDQLQDLVSLCEKES